MEALTIGQLARRGRIHVETIRYYERRGLLPRPARTQSGYRAFEPDTVRRIRFIKRAQELGFSLKEIKDLLSLRATTGARCADVLRRAQVKMQDIEEKIRTLRAMKRALERLAEQCSGKGPASTCPLLEALDLEPKA